MPSRDSRLEALEEALRRFEEAARHAPASFRTGNWGIRELVVHMAAWLEEGSRRIPLLLAGAPSKAYDMDEFNAAAIGASKPIDLQAAWARYRHAREAFRQAVSQVPDAVLARDVGPSEWLAGAAGHAVQHAQDLEAFTSPH